MAGRRVMTKERLATEKGTFPWVTGLLIFIGGMCLLGIYSDIQAGKSVCNFEHCFQIAFGLGCILAAWLLSYWRELLKLNKWHPDHIQLIDRKTLKTQKELKKKKEADVKGVK